MATRTRLGLAGATAAAICAVLVTAARAQAPERAAYDFEDGPQGFAAITLRNGAVEADAGSSASVTREKELVHGGAAALAYAYKLEPGAMRVLAAQAGIPKATKSVRFWARSAQATTLVWTLREGGGPDYSLSFYVPANEWVPVAANLDELTPGDSVPDRARKLDTGAVGSITLMDFATVLVNASPEIAKLLPDFKGERKVWLDDVQFSPERLPQAGGLVTVPSRAFLVDNFETGLVRWVPVRVPVENGVFRIEVFPPDTQLQVRPDAAPPGNPKTVLDAGGKGLRFSYNRGAQDAFLLVRSLDKEDLSAAQRLRLSINMSRKSLIIVQVKEKDDSEYQRILMPDETQGWQNLDLALSDLTLSDNSKDENNKLDTDQIKEISIADASIFAQLEGGATMMELDGISFTLR